MGEVLTPGWMILVVACLELGTFRSERRRATTAPSALQKKIFAAHSSALWAADKNITHFYGLYSAVAPVKHVFCEKPAKFIE